MAARDAFLNLGFAGLVSRARLVAIVHPDAAPIRRLVQEARDRGALIDASCGKKTRSVLIMDSDHIILSALETTDFEEQLKA